MPSSQRGINTKGIEALLGDPKKAIIKLSIPIIIAMFVQTLYTLADGIWVAGMGPEALSAVGFFFPFFVMLMGISNGMGIGGGAAISRHIGARDKNGADMVAGTTLVLMLIMTVLFTIPAVMFAESIFSAMGADESLYYATSYAKVMFAGILFIFFYNISNALLRAEGDANRAMIAMIMGSGLNIILDPIFIYGPNNPGPGILDVLLINKYGFDLEVAGAAYATVLSMFITSILIVFWLFIKRDTYVSFKLCRAGLKKDILKDIFKVAIPAILMHISMATMMLLENIIVVNVGGEDGVAVFTAGWRMLMIAILPTLGIATAVISVTGATFGAKRYDKLATACAFALKFALGFEIIVAMLMFFLAPLLHRPFTYGEGSERQIVDLIGFIRIMAFFPLAIAFAMLSSSMFQGIGKGLNALIVTLQRDLIYILPLSFLIGMVLNLGLNGVWVGTVLGAWLAGITAFFWGWMEINNLKQGRFSLVDWLVGRIFKRHKGVQIR